MADQTLTPTPGLKAGILDVTAHGNKKIGTAAGNDWWYIPNDGKTVLVVVAGAAVKAITFTPVLDKYGRTETLVVTPTASKTSVLGPFLQELWNDAQGRIAFKPAAGGDAGDTYLALQVAVAT